MVWAWMLWQPYALGTRTLSCFGHGRIAKPVLLEHERYHGLGMGASATVCSRNTNVIMVWAWMLWQPYALGTRTLSWFGHGCSGNRMLLEQERYHGFGMDALATVCSRNTNVIMVWAWMLWQPYALGTRTLSWFGHGCSGNRMLLEQERYHGLGMDALATVCSRNTNGTRTLSCFGHGRIAKPVLLEHERYHGLGMGASATVCSRNTNVIMLWAWPHCQACALGTGTLSWFGHGRIGNRMLSEHERYHGLGMDALATVCSRNTNVIMVWAWAHRQPYALGTRTLSWFGHGCSGNRMLLEQERYHGLGMDALATVCSWNRNVIMVWAWMLWQPYALGTRTEHERYHALGMAALPSLCSWNTNVIMVWAWAHRQPYALGTRTLSWFGHGCSGNRMLLEHERYHGLGMDALATVCSWNRNVIMVWAWMLWQPYALGTRTLSWFGHGCSGNRMLSEHERYHGLGMAALASVCSSCLLCPDPDKMPSSGRCFHIRSQVHVAATRTRCQPRAPHGVASLCQAGADRLTFRNVRRPADIPKCAFYQGSLVAHLPKTTAMCETNSNFRTEPKLIFLFPGPSPSLHA